MRKNLKKKDVTLNKHSKLEKNQISSILSRILSKSNLLALASAGFTKLDDEQESSATALTLPLAIRAACPAIATILYKNAFPTPQPKKNS